MFSLFLSMLMDKKILDLEKRRKIYNFILNHPGVHLRLISKKIKMPYTTIRHHIHYLERHDLIIKKSDGKSDKLYIKNKVSRKDKDIIGFLQQNTQREIILLLLAYVECSISEISKNLNRHPSTILFHLKKLHDKNIVEHVENKNGLIKKDDFSIKILRKNITNESVYMLKKPDVIYDLLIRYKHNISDDSAIVSIVLDYIRSFLEDGVPDRILSPRSSIDSIEKMIFEDLFPPSFCA